MKKLTALVALALLAIAGTGYAVTCAQDNVPAATLLVPYFRVGGAGITGSGASLGDIPDTSGTDTLVAVTNVSSTPIIIHVTLWNKYSVAVLDFNVPMTGYDVVFWSMRAILNGQLIVNPAFQKLDSNDQDPCGQMYNSDGTVSYPLTAASALMTPYLKFPNPDQGSATSDAFQAISVYASPAFGGAFRQNVWTSLDESFDISNWLSKGAAGAGVIDVDNYACNASLGATTAAGTTIAGDFSGYVTIDVANFCTQAFPSTDSYYINDAIATLGWGYYPGSNVIMGDVFYKDQTPGLVAGGAMGNISGDQTVPLEFDARLYWGPYASIGVTRAKTFYGRYYNVTDNFNVGPNAAYSFPGDGREPLGTHYAFRYLQTAAPTALRTWIEVWRSGTYLTDTKVTDLCGWWAGKTGSKGFTDAIHDITVKIYDNDENQITGSGGPSGGPTPGKLYIYLETQRLVVTPNAGVVQTTFLGGWINLQFGGTVNGGTDPTEQAFVEVQHSGLGLAMSVGHSATLLDGQFVCRPKPNLTHDQRAITPTILEVGQAVQTDTGLVGAAVTAVR